LIVGRKTGAFMDTQDIKGQVRAYIVNNFLMGRSADSLKDMDSFMDTHVVDSTGFLELVTFIEDTWKISVNDEEMVPENLDSLNNIDAYVRRKTAA
jgi:acyl carrier protein